MKTCRFDRETKKHLTREHLADCTSVLCSGCRPCRHDEHGNLVRHCRVRNRCTSHLGWTEHACPECLGKIRANLTNIVTLLALMPDEALEQGINSEAANLAGPHADYVTAQWALVNADRAGYSVEELDLSDPYTCLTMHERTIREDLGHDEETLVSPTIAASAGYLAWVLTDLARDEGHALHLSGLLGDTAELVAHMESALRNDRRPDRGVPCPVCVEAQAKRKAELIEAKVPKDEWPSLRSPRLERHWGHYCDDPRCAKGDYDDTSQDFWVCPQDRSHIWTHAAYENYLTDRGGRMSA